VAYPGSPGANRRPAGPDDALADFTSSDHVGRRDRQHRQRLYPVLRGGRPVGVASRRDLLDLAAVPGDARVVGDVMVSRPLVVHQDHTLREVAHDFAEYGVARAPVVDRDEPTTLLGLITVTQLLDGRARDRYEERVSERVLRPRPPAWARRRSLERG
jgi:Mg/Co/Ni transporter MgtE